MINPLQHCIVCGSRELVRTAPVPLCWAHDDTPMMGPDDELISKEEFEDINWYNYPPFLNDLDEPVWPV